MPGLPYEAIILAGGDEKSLYPFTVNSAKALLPIANKPLISYPLKSLQDAGLKHVFLVVSGDSAASEVQTWLKQEYHSDMQCEVIKVPEDCGAADALRATAPRVKAPNCIVLSGDLITDINLKVLVASHQMNGALMTMVLFKRKVSPSSETKPGKVPKNVDYIGLDQQKQHLLYYASSPESLRDLKIPLSAVRRHGTIALASDLINAHCYVMNRCVLDLLQVQTKLVTLRQDLLPYLAMNQRRIHKVTETAAAVVEKRSKGAGAAAGGASREEDSDDKENEEGGDKENGGGAHQAADLELPGAHYMAWSHTSPEEHTRGNTVRVHLLEEGQGYCARVTDVACYGDVNREVADSGVALHLAGLTSSPQYDNVVPHSTCLGSKATVTSGCVLGEQCVVGDKSSIKRSVLGHGCRLGASVKVINSVLQNDVVIGDGCTIQNSVLCAGVQAKERASVKDCQIGYNYVLAGGTEYKGEVLAKTPK